MLLVQRIHASLTLVRRFLVRRYSKLVYVDLDIAFQKVRLSGYTSNIRKVDSFSEDRSGKFCIFVFYDPSGRVSGSVRRILTCLHEAGVNTLIVCNHALGEDQKSVFKEVSHSIIERGNQGFDFGAFKDAISYLQENGFDPERLILLNDSIFYREKGLGAFVSGLLGSADVIAAFENWAEDYHMQSFALSLSNRVFRARPFREFWKGYVPVNNRIHAIENGEKRLSAALLASGVDSKVLYSVADLYRQLVKDDLNLDAENIHIPIQWRRVNSASETDPARTCQSRHEVAEFLSQTVGATSPIHSGPYYFAKYLECPIFKRDLVYRQRFHFWEIDDWSKEIMQEDERVEFCHMLRQKGDANSLPPAKRRRYDVGVI